MKFCYHCSIGSSSCSAFKQYGFLCDYEDAVEAVKSGFASFSSGNDDSGICYDRAAFFHVYSNAKGLSKGNWQWKPSMRLMWFPLA